METLKTLCYLCIGVVVIIGALALISTGLGGAIFLVFLVIMSQALYEITKGGQ